MNGESLDIKQTRLQALKERFPDLFVEGQLDWEKIKAAFGEDINFANERYVLNWAGKADAFKILQQPTTATLKPVPEESVNFDKSENLFVEGENLEVLKVLQKAYYGKVKVVCIDPPYNTGNDSFIYPDRFSEKKEDYLKRIGDKDEEGYLMKEGFFRKNSKDSGHFHSNWLSMMYPRLFLAKNLLRDDGVIFVHIDDNEVHNLRLVMNEIFGEENFVAQFVWKKRTTKSDVPFGVSQDYEWILCFTKDNFNAGISHERKYYQTEDFPKDRWRLADLTKQTTAEERPNSAFDMIDPKTKKIYPFNPNRVWGVTKDTFPEYYKKGKIVFPDDYDFLNITIPAFRVFESEDKAKALKKFGSEEAKKSVSTHLPKEVGMNEDGNKDILELFDSKVFSFPKPVSLIKHFLTTISEKNAIILDFFGGSGTTAHAVLELNREDGGNRKFILVQMPEPCEENSEAYKAGYKTIADIAKERIRRVIRKIENKNEPPLPLLNKGGELNISSPPILGGVAEGGGGVDFGFKVFKLSPSNFKIWRGSKITEENLEQQLDAFTNPVRPGSDKENMLFELMLKAGYELTSNVEYITTPAPPYEGGELNSSSPPFQGGVSEGRGGLKGHVSNQKYLKEKRKELRNNSTAAEASLWKVLQNSQIENKKFRRQHSIGNYILDFYCPECLLAIELDGAHHFTGVGSDYDKERDEYLQSLGIRILRIENKIIYENPEGVIETIRQAILTTPLSPPYQGGELSGFYSINNNELIIVLDAMSEKLVEQIIAAKPQKIITLDSLFTGNDQLKTNTVLQMRDAGVDFKTI